MKSIRGYLIGGALLCLTLLSGVARAATITVLSAPDPMGTVQWNSVTTYNVDISPWVHPNWAVPSLGGRWISFVNTGFNQTEVPSSFPPGDPPTATFYARFTLPGPALSGGIWFWADDTAEVLLNGVQRLSYTTQQAQLPNPYCAAGSVSCQQSAGGYLNMAGYLAGDYLLELRTWQLWGGPFGVLYEGSVDIAPIPEPGQFWPIAVALIALGFRFVPRRRR